MLNANFRFARPLGAAVVADRVGAAAAGLAARMAAVLWVLSLSCFPTFGAPETGVGFPVRREVLALYDANEEPTPDRTRVHRFAEMPLNHLGFVVTYWDVNAGFPEAERLTNVHGLVLWFQNPQRADVYVWALRAATRGIRIVVLGDGGLPRSDAGLQDANRLFHHIGFEFAGPSIDLTYASRVTHRDAMIGFEREPDQVLPPYPTVNVVGPDVERHLTLDRRAPDLASPSQVVLTSPRGGFAANGYFVHQAPGTATTQWIVDPFAFLRSALGSPFMPIPDVTTLSGRRIYFSHIDGDGWNNLSRIERYRDQQMISAAVVQHELIEAYPDLPVSVGVIGADVDPRYGRVTIGQKVARDLYELPQVEVATHSFTHPFTWKFFEQYDRARELAAIERPELGWMPNLVKRVRDYSSRILPGIMRNHRHGDSIVAENDPPRAFSNFPFDLEQEIAGAVRASQSLAPADKRTALFLWSGDAEPFAAAIAETRQLGIGNLNGGDSRVDPDTPSISYVASISRPVGTERQIYAPNANDYVYMSDGVGREFGYLHLSTTIAGTEKPRRLKPIDVYYHMYAGERAAELNAVRHHLDFARHAPLVPIAASRYTAIAEGFHTATIATLAPSTWRIGDRRALQTVRFDDASDRSVDFDRSVGVIGQQRKGPTLYVTLDSAIEDAVVALSSAAVAPNTPHLVESRWTFSDLRRHTCGFTVDAEGYGQGDMTWRGLTPGPYRVTLRQGNESLLVSDIDVDRTGTLALSLKADAIDPVLLDVSCRE